MNELFCRSRSESGTCDLHREGESSSEQCFSLSLIRVRLENKSAVETPDQSGHCGCRVSELSVKACNTNFALTQLKIAECYGNRTRALGVHQESPEFSGRIAQFFVVTL